MPGILCWKVLIDGRKQCLQFKFRQQSPPRILRLALKSSSSTPLLDRLTYFANSNDVWVTEGDWSTRQDLPGNGGTTAYLWVGDSPAEVSDRCGGCCLFCLSVCLLSLSRGGWCVVGLPSCLWPAICEPLVSLRTFLPWATPWRFLPWISPWRCESGPRTCEVPLDDEAVRFLCCSEVLRAGGFSGSRFL